MIPFNDRVDAGRQLAAALSRYRGRPDVLVLGLPRGGLPVAAVVAATLGVPLDIFLVRKVGVPGHPELAMGAVAEGGVEVLANDTIRDLDIPFSLVAQAAARERLELERRNRQYRGERPRPPIRDRTVILIDDGLATGATMEAAIVALRESRPAAIVAAAPVGARETCQRLRAVADEVVCLATPEPFTAVGLWYRNFDQTSDDEVRALLAEARAEPRPSGV